MFRIVCGGTIAVVDIWLERGESKHIFRVHESLEAYSPGLAPMVKKWYGLTLKSGPTSAGEAGVETGEETCGSETYKFSPKEKSESEATAPTKFPLPSRKMGSMSWVLFCAGSEEDRLNALAKGAWTLLCGDSV